MFERFTDRARRVLVLAQEEARLLNHSFIGTEHLLLGLIHEGEGVAAKALEELDITLEDVRERVEEKVGISRTLATGSPPFTPRTKKVLELSLREALQLGHEYIGTEHMLLGLVREGEGVGVQVLVALGADIVSVRQTVIRLLSGYHGQSESVPQTPERRKGRRSRARLSRVSTTTWEEPSRKGRAGLVACSFCGRQPPETGQLISGSDAFICEHCVRAWYETLEEPGDLVGAAIPRPQYEADAISAIVSLFAKHWTAQMYSEDGESLVTVEHGEHLGPTAREAKGRRPDLFGEVVTLLVDEVVLLDAEHAAVRFHFSGDPEHRRGDAVLDDGSWKMTRSTFCELMGLAGVECPPPSEGPEL